MMIYLLLAIMNMAGNCKKDNPLKDDDLSIKRTNYTGSQLGIDGYYYQKVDATYFSIYFFYRNGIVLSAGGSFSNESEMNNYIVNEFINNKSYQNSKYDWGVFQIENNTILFEHWYPSEYPYKAYVRAGSILNDTTFLINESYRMQDGKKTEVKTRNETYHFKQFSTKPDSTNNFVK
ncbi:MAG: hypothetical protein V1781_07100 [Bacteroidota bacterium]